MNRKAFPEYQLTLQDDCFAFQIDDSSLDKYGFSVGSIALITPANTIQDGLLSLVKVADRYQIGRVSKVSKGHKIRIEQPNGSLTVPKTWVQMIGTVVGCINRI